MKHRHVLIDYENVWPVYLYGPQGLIAVYTARDDREVALECGLDVAPGVPPRLLP